MLAVAGWLTFQATRIPPRRVYSRTGYGGLVPPQPATAKPSAGEIGQSKAANPGLGEYNAGHYAEAEQLARRIVVESTESGVGAPEESARARWVLAFSAARRQDLPLARRRFAELKSAAAGKPWTLEEPKSAQESSASRSTAESAAEHPANVTPARPVSPTGASLPTLEEEAAYQHAVLTQAVACERASPKTELGKNYSAEAERELVEFMHRYPESPLVHAAVRRVGMMHGGNIPKYAEKVWQDAMKSGQAQQHARERERSLCGPEVLVEVLRRTGEEPDLPTVRELAEELRTDHQGTTLKAVAKAAEQRGRRTKGYRLTWDGLWSLTHGKNTPTPGAVALIALIKPGHYVLIEQVTAGWVTAWDPSRNGEQQPGSRMYNRAEWEKGWTGVALRVER